MGSGAIVARWRCAASDDEYAQEALIKRATSPVQERASAVPYGVAAESPCPYMVRLS